MAQARLTGIHHVVLNVSDLDRSVRWYCETLDFRELFTWNTADFDRRLLIHPSGTIIGLTRHHHSQAGTPFSEVITGLDHLAFAVESREVLDAWVERLDRAGVAHSGVQVRPETGFTLLPLRDPDGIQLELYVS